MAPPPLLPGLQSTHARDVGRTHFRRGQLLARMAVGKPTSVEQAPPTALALPPPAPAPAPAPAPTRSAAAAGAAAAFRADPTQPRWLTHDRQVLRFFGYVEDGGCVRRLAVCFHLGDGSLSVSEPRVANSGRAHGAFLRRTRLSTPGPAGPAPLSPDDLRVGGELRVCGHVVRLVACDGATRAFYRARGVSAAALEPRAYPDDPVDAAAREAAELRERLRRRAQAQSESAAARARQARELSGKVLRFSAAWRDPHPLYASTRRLALLFFLADDALELRELPPPPARPRVLLSRRRVALERPPTDESPAAAAPPARMLRARDLRCGDWLRVLARDLFLEDCDEFTRGYCLEALGVTQERFSIDAAPAPAPASAPAPAPSAAKWELFRAAPPAPATGRREHDERPTRGRDELAGRQLRFRARLHALPAGHADADRRFVLCFFLEDASLAVFEPRRADGAAPSGRFLDRHRARAPSAAYRAADFFVGAVVALDALPGRRLELLEADAQTLAWCEARPELFPSSDARAAVDKLAGRPDARDLLSELARQLDPGDGGGGGDSAGADASARLSAALGALTARGLNAQQALTLCRRFAADADAARAMTSVCSMSRPAAGEPRVRLRALCEAVAARAAALRAASQESNAPTASDAQTRGLHGLRSKLLRAPCVFEPLVGAAGGTDGSSTGWVSMPRFFEATAAEGVELDDRDVKELVALGCVRNGRIDARRLRELVQARGGAGDEPETRGGELHTGRTHDDSLTEDDWWSSRTSGDECEPQGGEDATWASPRRMENADSAPVLPLRLPTPLARGQADANTALRGADAAPRRAEQPPPPPRDARAARVAALLQRVFGTRKYQLRRALRDRDRDRSGRLTEDDFMDAVLSLEPALSDDDTYLIADAFFPTNNCAVDYAALLERAFRADNQRM